MAGSTLIRSNRIGSIAPRKDPNTHTPTRVRATTHATESAATVVSFAYRAAGSDALRNGGVLQRCFRDVHAGTQHLFVDEKTMVDAAKVLLAQADPALMI